MRLTYQNILATLLLSMLAFSSCRDEDLMDSIYLGDGRTVNVTIPISVSGRSVHTRIWIPEEDENKVQDFYLLAYRAGESSTYKLAAKRYFAQGEGMLEGGKLNMTLPTGTYKLVGVANLKPGAIHESLFNKIDSLPVRESTYEDLKAIKASLKTKGDIERSTPALTMSGENTVAIKGEGETEAIPLTRLDAAVKFVFKPADGSTTKIGETEYTQKFTSFKLTGWQVFRIPNEAALFQEEGQDACNDFSDMKEPNINFDTKDKETQTAAATEEETSEKLLNGGEFSFYMLENKKKPKKIIESKGSYSLRNAANAGFESKNVTDADKPVEKEENGNGNGIWKYANDSSTYVKVTASMDMELTAINGGETITRHADATYYIHLGCTKTAGSKADVNDYNTVRNGKYTYNVTVKGVNQIVVEATNENAEEYQNGISGTVIDFGSDGKRIELDAHYSVFNITMTPKEILEMSLEIKSPENNYLYTYKENNEYTDEDKKIPETYDWQSIRFAIQEDERKNYLVNYSNTYDVASFGGKNQPELKSGMDKIQNENDNHTIPLYDFRTLKQHVSEQVKGKNMDENKPLTLTVFVNEYVYYDKSYEFINAQNRIWRIYGDRKTSKHDNCVHISAKYTVVQRAIQSYYPTGSNQIIGWEHTNEHFGKKICLPPQLGAINLSNVDGLRNVWYNILKRNYSNYNSYIGLENPNQDNKWTTWATPTEALSTKEGYYAFKTKTVKEAANSTVDGKKYDYTTNFAYCINKNYGGKFWDKDDAIYDAITACLSRNRDLNRNGIIDEEEIRWFLPTDQQYVDAVIGARSLVTPLVSLEEVSNQSNFPTNDGFPEEDLQYPYVLLPYHFVGSNNRKLWGEQFIATGTVFIGWADDLLTSSKSNNKYQNVGWNFRCARYIDKTKESKTGLNPGKGTDKDSKPYISPYKHNENNHTIRADYESNSLRNPETGYLVVHGSFQEFNRTSLQFRYSKKTKYLDSQTLQPYGKNEVNKNAGELWRKLSTNGWASEYYEEPDQSDRGTWRLPNLRELALLNMEGVLESQKRYLSGSTYWDLTKAPSPIGSFSSYEQFYNLDIYYKTDVGSGNIARVTPYRLLTYDIAKGYYLIFVRDEF